MGAELSFQAQLFDWFVLTSGYDFIRGLNFQTSKPLPLIPANRFRLEAKLVTESIWFLVNPYFVLSANAFESQNRIEEYEKRTGGYTLYSVGAGFELEIGQSRANIYFAIENIFNIAYSDHLYRYKDYALNPGRNYELKLSVPFTLIN
jgi:iron complex outermembrane receptor protein